MSNDDTEEKNNKEYAEGYARGRSGDLVRDTFHHGDDRETQDYKGYEDGMHDRSRYGYKNADECGTGETTKDDSCCYIVSACLDSLGLPRTSPELTAMKTLTRGHILRSFRGKRDYISYGRMAPVIVQAIRANADSQTTWVGIYEALKTVADAVVSGNCEEGYQRYRSLVLALEERFLNR